MRVFGGCVLLSRCVRSCVCCWCGVLVCVPLNQPHKQPTQPPTQQQPYQSKDDEEGTSGIIVPLLPFGLRKYDDGERFDLRSPYSDDGWVDPEETDMWGSFRNIGQKLLNFGGVKTPVITSLCGWRGVRAWRCVCSGSHTQRPQPKTKSQEAGKPIVWASQYDKFRAEKKQQQQQQGGGGGGGKGTTSAPPRRRRAILRSDRRR